jgi:hypothetical protein
VLDDIGMKPKKVKKKIKMRFWQELDVFPRQIINILEGRIKTCCGS